MPRRVTFDPRWNEISASLRKGALYVKMPLSHARVLITVLEEVLGMSGYEAARDYLQPMLVEFLGRELTLATQTNTKALVYSILEDNCRQDIEQLKTIEPGDITGLIERFRGVLEAGLANEPDVDWISRIGGPKADLRYQDSPQDTESIQFDIDDLFSE